MQLMHSHPPRRALYTARRTCPQLTHSPSVCRHREDAHDWQIRFLSFLE
ncbi:hypothetical protein LAUMK41_05839 [Mycobacterium attenuatum]|nr:hypothetical protein LAUMK41_05839 [Mycobacterium attenuatum]